MRGFIVIAALIAVLGVVGWLNADSWIAVASLFLGVWLIGLAIRRVGDVLGHQDLSTDHRKFPLDKGPQ
jgi:hypothetical protein